MSYLSVARRHQPLVVEALPLELEASCLRHLVLIEETVV